MSEVVLNSSLLGAAEPVRRDWRGGGGEGQTLATIGDNTAGRGQGEGALCCMLRGWLYQGGTHKKYYNIE